MRSEETMWVRRRKAWKPTYSREVNSAASQ
jgi:hypothetical protein